VTLRADLAFAFNPRRDDHAYFLGLFATDGTIYESSRNRGRVTFELCSTDASVLRVLADRIPYRSHFRDRYRNTNFAQGYRSVVLTFHDLRFRRELAALGYVAGKKSETVGPPRCVHDESGFWRGVVDGDGSLGMTGNERPFVSLVTASEQLRNAYVEFVARVAGVRPNPQRNARDRVFNIVVFDEPAQALVAQLYSDELIAIPRKLNAAKIVAAWRRPANRKRIDFERRKWTPEEDRSVLAGPPVAVIAAELGRTARSVNIRRWRLRASPLSRQQ
jgi:hypothetical protein